MVTGSLVQKPYMHRWKPEYMKAPIAKFYLLDKWAFINNNRSMNYLDMI